MASKSAGFSRFQRLIKPDEFGPVFARPVRSSDRYFTVLGRANNCDNARLGLAISKRVDKRAVVRNRLKRLAREVFRKQRDLPSWDFVVLARSGAQAADNSALRESLSKHFIHLTRRANASDNE